MYQTLYLLFIKTTGSFDNKIGHLRVALCLCVKTSLCAKPFIWKCSAYSSFFTQINSSSFERFCTRTRFKTEAQWHKDIVSVQSNLRLQPPLLSDHLASATIFPKFFQNTKSFQVKSLYLGTSCKSRLVRAITSVELKVWPPVSDRFTCNRMVIWL